MTPSNAPPRFIADGSLGRLARILRTLGFDCAYDGGLSIQNATLRALSEERILLTSHPLASTVKLSVIRITSDELSSQLFQVERSCDLRPFIHAFSRCLVCGSLISGPYPPGSFPAPDGIAVRRLSLWRCEVCQKTYWRGSHIERMRIRLKDWGWTVNSDDPVDAA